MTPDLTPCQPIFSRDPVRYLDMTEPVRRGIGRVLAASPTGALTAFNDLLDGTQFGFSMFAQDRETAAALLDLLPERPGFVTVHETLYFDLLEERFGFSQMNLCWQVGYLRKTPLPLPDLGVEVRPLELSHLPTVLANYQLEDEEYLRWLIGRGELYGAFEGGTLTAFAGRHGEGSVGLLEVLPPYRRRGIAALLQSYVINRELSLGRVPFGQVFDGNEPSLALQRKLGLEVSKEPVYWPDF